MKPRHQATRTAVELIKRFEGFRARSARLPDGGYTIGYGHTRTAREGATVSEADADALLIYDVAGVVTALNEWVFSPLTQNQFDALVAFGFNIGLPNFRRSSVLRRLNEGSHLQAACAMEMWRTADFEGERIVIDALVRRRSAEMALFLTPQDGYIPVPSLIVLPRVDEQVARIAPLSSSEIETPLEGAIAAMVLRAGTQPPTEPTASRTASDAVTARLNALLQDAPVTAAEAEPVLAAPPVEDELAVDPEPELRIRAVAEAVYTPMIHAEPEAELESEAAYHAQPEAEPVQESEPHVEPELPAYDPAAYAAAEAAYNPEPIDQATPLDDLSLDAHPALQPLIFHARPTGSLTLRRKSKQATEPMLALMGVAGLGIAGGGVFWSVNANAAERLPLLPDPQMTGFGVSLAGIAMLVASVYLLLTRLAARDS
jgi:lysozyme